jgi:hypothetical protein
MWWSKKEIEDINFDNDVAPVELNSFMDGQKELSLNERVGVLMYQLDRIENKIDELLKEGKL